MASNERIEWQKRIDNAVPKDSHGHRVAGGQDIAVRTAFAAVEETPML